MKLNLEIEIDWIDEESNLDETVKSRIIDTIVNKLEASIRSKVEDRATSKVEKRIDKLVDETFSNFMKKEINVTDKYGDEIKSYSSIKEMIKEKFDKFLTELVDKDGRSSSYSANTQRVKYIIDEQLKQYADKFTTDAVEQVSTEIRKHVQDGLTQKLGKELMKVLKVEKMIGLPEGKK